MRVSQEIKHEDSLPAVSEIMSKENCDEEGEKIDLTYSKARKDGKKSYRSNRGSMKETTNQEAQEEQDSQGSLGVSSLTFLTSQKAFNLQQNGYCMSLGGKQDSQFRNKADIASSKQS